MRRLLAPVAAVLLAAVLAGCVGMPHDGPVVSTREQSNPVSAQGAPFIDPLPPQAGQSRTEIVRGFINAMQKWPADTTTAKKFLTTDAAAAWNPQDEMITFDSPPTPRDVGGDVVVTLPGTPHRLDARGAWEGALPANRRTMTFPLVRDHGEWRIDRAPNALIVPQTWFTDRYRQASLYFFDPTASILTPEPVFVPRGEQLATTLVQALLRGPAPRLGHVTQTFVPSGLDVAVGVTVSADGVADILLTGDAGQLSANAVELMMAQFAWTLRQEPQIESIRVSIGGQPVPLPGGVSSYRVDGGAEYDPAGFQASPLLYGLSRGRLVSGTAAALTPVEGPLGSRSRDLRSVGVSLDATRAACVTGGGTSVLLGPVADDARTAVRTVARGTDFLRPAWDFEDRMWLVDRTARGARVYYADHHGGAALTALRVPGITGERVRMFLVSRDGTRLVAVVRRGGDDVLVVSRIEHTAAGNVAGALQAERIGVGDDLDVPIRDISWRTSASIAVLNPLTPSLADIAPASVDGAPATDAGTTTIDGRILALAGSPALDEKLYGVTSRGLVDVASTDHASIVFDKPTRAVVYVG